jgi:hypothetical protein
LRSTIVEGQGEGEGEIEGEGVGNVETQLQLGGIALQLLLIETIRTKP